MTLTSTTATTHTSDRVAPVERIAVRCVDSDVHPMPRQR